MMETISPKRVDGEALDALFREARTHGAWLPHPVPEDLLREAYDLAKLGPAVISDRSRMIMTYALCGFANIASVGINVAGYSVLVPERRQEIMGMVWKAMLAGFLATCLTASIVGAMPSSLFGS